MSKGRVGASLGGIEMSNRKKRALARRRRSQEAEWAARSGPVVVRSSLPVPDQAERA